MYWDRMVSALSSTSSAGGGIRESVEILGEEREAEGMTEEIEAGGGHFCPKIGGDGR
jgi:hypothetical protein